MNSPISDKTLLGNNGTVDYNDFLKTIKMCFLPEQIYEWDQPLTPDHCSDHKSETEVNLEKCLSILNVLDQLSFQTVPREVIINIILVCGENHKLDLWVSERCLGQSQDILKRVLEISGCSTISSLLIKHKVNSFFSELRPKLEIDSWKKHPAAVSSFAWILSNIKCPHLGDHINSVLPTCLLLVDDHENTNKILGLKCLEHLAINVSGAELKHYGRGDVIYNAVEHMMFSRESAILSALTGCLVSLLAKTEHNTATKTLKWCRFDDVLNVWLPAMQLEQNVNSRTVYIEGLHKLLLAMDLSSVRWSDTLLDVFSEYCDHDSTRYKALECLSSFITLTWPRMEHNFDRLILIIMKVLVSAPDKHPEHSTMLLVSQLLRSLEKLSETQYQEFVRDFQGSIDFHDLLPFLKVEN